MLNQSRFLSIPSDNPKSNITLLLRQFRGLAMTFWYQVRAQNYDHIQAEAMDGLITLLELALANVEGLDKDQPPCLN